MPPVELWAWAFAWTCAIEVPVVLLLLGPRAGWMHAGLAALAAQVLTHPALWYLVPRFEPYEAWLICAELGVTAVEAGLFLGLLRARGVPRSIGWAVGTSVLANTVSTVIGLWLV